MSNDTSNDLPEWVKPDENEIKVTYSGMGAANVYQNGTNYVRIAPVDLDAIREMVAREVRKALAEVGGYANTK